MLGPGKRLWRKVIDSFDLDAPELLLLAEACRTADLCSRLQAELDETGPILDSGRLNPAAAELRQQRLVLARLISSLQLPKGLADDAQGA